MFTDYMKLHIFDHVMRNIRPMKSISEIRFWFNVGREMDETLPFLWKPGMKSVRLI